MEGDGADPASSPLPSPTLDAHGPPCQGTQALNLASHSYMDTEELHRFPALCGKTGKNSPTPSLEDPVRLSGPDERCDTALHAHLVDVPPCGVQRREEPLQFCSATKIEDPGGQELLAVLSKLLNTKREARHYHCGPHSALGQLVPKHHTYQDTVLLASLRGDGSDVRQLHSAQ